MRVDFKELPSEREKTRSLHFLLSGQNRAVIGGRENVAAAVIHSFTFDFSRWNPVENGHNLEETVISWIVKDPFFVNVIKKNWSGAVFFPVRTCPVSVSQNDPASWDGPQVHTVNRKSNSFDKDELFIPNYVLKYWIWQRS